MHLDNKYIVLVGWIYMYIYVCMHYVCKFRHAKKRS